MNYTAALLSLMPRGLIWSRSPDGALAKLIKRWRNNWLFIEHFLYWLEARVIASAMAINNAD